MKMAGKIEDGGLVEFLRAVTTLGSSGRLEIRSGGHEAQIILRGGRVVAAITNETPRLGEILTEAGAISDKELDGVLAIQKRKRVRQPLGMILVQLGVLESDRLESHLQDLRTRAVKEILAWDTGTYDFSTEEESDIWGRDPGGLRLDEIL
jgi:hypothetical protein